MALFSSASLLKLAPSKFVPFFSSPRRHVHVPKHMWGRPNPKYKKGEKHGRYWRSRQGLPNVLDETGPLAELPDWTFADGRPGPLSRKQTAKVLEQQRLLRDVVAGLEFIKFAQSRPDRHAEEEESSRRAILDSKLRPKGNLVLE